jgi:hypothetical protein
MWPHDSSSYTYSCRAAPRPRDQRAEENWALLLARHLAASKGVPLAVCFNLVPTFLEATVRQYG